MKRAYEFGTVYAFVAGEGKNFGWILPDAGLPRLFFHLGHLVGPEVGERVPKKGDRMIFTRGKTRRKGPRVHEVQFDPFVRFGLVCHEQLETTAQYGAYYIGGLLETPDLSEGIRIDGSAANYQSLKIHRDDVPRLVERIKKWERALLADQTVFLCMSETQYFCTNSTDPQDVPNGFTLTPIRLPIKIKRQEHLPDGIIAAPLQLVYYLGYVVVGAWKRQWIANPNPAHEPEYSGFYKR